ncbi:hypothetical protein EVAR_97447_1 [Eumeta japonica]|uniref:Uncharacterized protein n=1 Tax=Eumeta variegata TaxID=151549 RepID=A0A4C1WWV7_EUMVA|nr:hypothetical protein EVAR_97447_1 [Eumeta japonica]
MYMMQEIPRSQTDVTPGTEERDRLIEDVAINLTYDYLIGNSLKIKGLNISNRSEHIVPAIYGILDSAIFTHNGQYHNMPTNNIDWLQSFILAAGPEHSDGQRETLDNKVQMWQIQRNLKALVKRLSQIEVCNIEIETNTLIDVAIVMEAEIDNDDKSTEKTTPFQPFEPTSKKGNQIRTETF